ncbi:hypothetical protein EJB05_14004, partial [Eragrostis curvula]
MSTKQNGGGDVAAERSKASDGDDAGGGEDRDRLSALPDDVLVLILLHLDTKNAARTSVLSRRWRRVWTLLPELRFGIVRQSQHLWDALSVSDVPLRYLLVGALVDPSPQSLASWLLTAARRVSGELILINFVTERNAEDSDEEEATERGAFELPCFEKATSISLDLGFLGISVPPNGVFARLKELSLSGVQFHSLGDLGDVVSSPRCPCLQKLTVCHARGLDRISIDSESLQVLELRNPHGLRQLTVVAPALRDLSVMQCFLNEQNQPVVNISAPQLKSLKWVDTYDPSFVHLGNTEHLQTFGTLFFVYGPHGFTQNRACLMLLPRFKAIENLTLSLVYMLEADNLQYMMEDMTVLPDIKCLHLIVMALGHAFGAGPFHVLRICSGIQRLILVLSTRFELKEETACSSGCICDQPTVWKTEELSLNHLQELEIQEFRASEHEVAFVKRLLNWATVLKMMTVTFHHSISDSKAKELFQMFRSLSNPGVCMEFYIYQEFRMVLYAPED